MDIREYLESGILELYVYGLLTEDENLKIASLASDNSEIRAEILSIEKSIVDLSASFSPFLSASAYENIREKLLLRHAKVVQMKRRANWPAYIGWAAAIIFLLGVGFLYKELDESYIEVAEIENENKNLQESVANLEIKNKQNENSLAIIRDANNQIIDLAGQQVAPQTYAKVYWNKQTQQVYLDAAGLPEPPQGMVYQVWSLKMNPLTPTSIGLLENFAADAQRIFALSNSGDAEAFGITLEPAGGSASPTLEQLYVLGKV